MFALCGSEIVKEIVCVRIVLKTKKFLLQRIVAIRIFNQQVSYQTNKKLCRLDPIIYSLRDILDSFSLPFLG